ncbi:MAG TPA: DUF2298 domain-containing protein [Chloroflexota bacterium]|nr:DUF2298 domain-containing protein [Chloroflexota bacterium]
MIDAGVWVLVIEAAGLAILPLACELFRDSPDRGYAFAKILGLLVLTYFTWIAGSFVPIAGTAWLPAIILILVASSWLRWGPSTVVAVRASGRTVVVVEAVFLLAFAAWTYWRATFFHPGIGHTEQYMDLALFTASGRSASFPPYDPWMSGHSLNYYYLGYLMYALVGKLAGVVPSVGYNLALSSVFALTLSGCLGLGLALTRRLSWALLFPAFVGLLGNWYAALNALAHGTAASASWFWDSTRVVDPNNTINEFPLFSFMLGDLHPHLMALPVAVLVIGFAVTIAAGRSPLALDVPTAARLLPAALAVGALYTINSWDLPTYFIVLAAGILIRAYLTDDTVTWWRDPMLLALGCGAAAVMLFSPFYVHFRSLAHGIGVVSTPTAPGQFVEVFGMFLTCIVLLLGAFGWLLQPADAEETPASAGVTSRPMAEAGAARVFDPLYLGLALALIAIALAAWKLDLSLPLLVSALVVALGIMLVRSINVARPQSGDRLTLLLLAAVAVATLGFHLQMWTLLLVIGVGLYAAAMLHRVLNTGTPNRADAVTLVLVCIACLVLALTELVYVKDAFDGGSMYRMNTVFKFYYQAWLLLGLAAAFAAFRIWRMVQRALLPRSALAALAVMGVAVMGGALYTWKAPDSYAGYQVGTRTGLDGMAWLADAHPGDYQVIKWLQQHGSGNPTILEAVGNDYSPDGARMSTFTGLPSVLGWIGHEQQWRPGDPEPATRAADISTIYRTRDWTVARRLLTQYHVTYVVVGDTERSINGADLGKFARFMRVAFRSGESLVYTW